MTWTDDEWDGFCGLLEEAWPGGFDDTAARSWRVLLDGLDPATAIGGLRRLLLEGHRFRPSVSEVLAAARRDPSRPTFDEALRMIYGRNGILAARPAVRRWRDERERAGLFRRAAAERAKDMHPLVASFVERQGMDRLRALELGCPEYGGARRAELRKAWDAHVEVMDGREVATLAAGGRRGEFGRFDPWAALEASGIPGLPAAPATEEAA